MNSSGLKAREIEALVFIQPRRPGIPTLHASTVGVAAVMVVAAALAWVLLRS
ncbi:MAG TPA: hypothetical protein VGR86_09810 [Steroidobacteraceae bacterium]|nr:hypothetical protein [Steroidobacteraceae bacterium]